MAKGRTPLYRTESEREQDLIQLTKQSERLKTLIKKNNYSIQKLAGELNKSRQSISAYCNASDTRRIRLQRVDAEELGKKFGVTADYLMGLSDSAIEEEEKISRERGLLEAEAEYYDALHERTAYLRKIFSSLGFEIQISDVDTQFEFESMAGLTPSDCSVRIRTGESAWSYFTKEDTDLLIENLKMSVQFAMFKSDQQRHKDV